MFLLRFSLLFCNFSYVAHLFLFLYFTCTAAENRLLSTGWGGGEGKVSTYTLHHYFTVVLVSFLVFVVVRSPMKNQIYGDSTGIVIPVLVSPYQGVCSWGRAGHISASSLASSTHGLRYIKTFPTMASLMRNITMVCTLCSTVYGCEKISILRGRGGI
jgi:hypothetical protein